MSPEPPLAPLRLALLRHGLVEGPGEDPPLSEAGVIQMEEAALGMRALGLRFDSIATSPLARARMTAKIVADAVGRSGVSPVVVESLAPGADLRALLRLPLAPPSDALVVGHAPDLGRMAAALGAGREPIAMGRGDLIVMRLDAWPPAAPGRLEWFVPSAQLRALGSSGPPGAAA